MDEHTPGPWKAELTDTNGHCGFSINSGDFQVATVYAMIIKAPRPSGGNASLPENAESLANARLIAAAPDLLEALHAMLDEHATCKGCIASELAFAAIAQATGQSQP